MVKLNKESQKELIEAMKRLHLPLETPAGERLLRNERKEFARILSRYEKFEKSKDNDPKATEFYKGVLVELGYLGRANVSEAKYRAAVKELQEDYKLPQDGKVGDNTVYAMAIAKFADIPPDCGLRTLKETAIEKTAKHAVKSHAEGSKGFNNAMVDVLIAQKSGYDVAPEKVSRPERGERKHEQEVAGNHKSVSGKYVLAVQETGRERNALGRTVVSFNMSICDAETGKALVTVPAKQGGYLSESKKSRGIPESYSKGFDVKSDRDGILAIYKGVDNSNINPHRVVDNSGKSYDGKHGMTPIGISLPGFGNTAIHADGGNLKGSRGNDGSMGCPVIQKGGRDGGLYVRQFADTWNAIPSSQRPDAFVIVEKGENVKRTIAKASESLSPVQVATSVRNSNPILAKN